MTVYVQVYLFIILYSYWIVTNIIQYLLYLVMLVPEYLSVFTHLYLTKWGQLLYQRIIQPFLRNTRTFNGGGVYSHTQAWQEGSAVMTTVFVIVIQIWSLLYVATRSDRPPLSAEKISLCLSHLVLEIHGHKVGQI